MSERLKSYLPCKQKEQQTSSPPGACLLLFFLWFRGEQMPSLQCAIQSAGNAFCYTAMSLFPLIDSSLPASMTLPKVITMLL